jgi:hypothetical protein
MTIDEAYRLYQFIANKQGNGYATPEEFNLSAKACEQELLNLRMGIPDKYVNGLPAQASAMTARLNEDTRPFLVATPLVLTNGIAPFPDNYLMWSSLESTYEWTEKVPVKTLEDADGEFVTAQKSKPVNIDVLDQTRFANRAGSSYKGPTLEHPICHFLAVGIKFAPSNISPTLTYFREPIGAIWGYDLVDDTPVYNKSKSRDYEMLPSNHSAILWRQLLYLGINISNAELVRVAGEFIGGGI